MLYSFEVGKPYPIPITRHQDLVVMLGPLTLLMALSGLTKDEHQALQGTLKITHHRYGCMSALRIESSQGNFEPIYHFTGREQLEDPAGQMLLMQIHLVDSDTTLVKMLRTFSLSPEISQSIFLASLDPQATPDKGVAARNVTRFDQALQGLLRLPMVGPMHQTITR